MKYKENIALESGYAFLCIWETEIKEDLNGVKQRIKNSINKESIF